MPKRVDVSAREGQKSRRAWTIGTAVRLARRQHSVVALPQMIGLGITENEVRGMVDSCLLAPVFRAVYLVGPGPLTDRGRWLAGTLASPPSLLAHRSALMLHSLLDTTPGPVHILTEGPARRRQSGLIPHRTRWLPSERRTEVAGIPVVVPMLAVVQASPRLCPGELREILARAEHRQLIDPDLIYALIAERPNLPRRRRLTVALAPHLKPVPFTRSVLETKFVTECKRRELRPLPASIVPIDRYEVDFYWEHSGLVVEVDGFQTHRSRDAFDRDRARWSRISSLGHPLIIVTADRLANDAEALFAEIAAINSVPARRVDISD